MDENPYKSPTTPGSAIDVPGDFWRRLINAVVGVSTVVFSFSVLGGAVKTGWAASPASHSMLCLMMSLLGAILIVRAAMPRE